MHVLDRVDLDRIRSWRERGDFFWLDLEAPTGADIDALASALELPPLAVEDTHEFGQRAKIDDYDERVLIVFFGAEDEPGGAGLVEVHVHLSRTEVVTVHRRRCRALEPVRSAHPHSDQETVYRILDALSESLLAHLRGIEQEVTGLEQRAFERPSAADRRRITELRGRLFRLLQVVVPQRDMLGDGAAVVERVLHMRGQVHHPFRDVRDDLVLAANLISYCRELLAEALNVYLQATSNRLNQVATRLTALATIFVPLTLITGFFGQNFAWLVNHIDSLGAFLALGIGGMVVPAAAIGLLLWRAGYLSGDGK